MRRSQQIAAAVALRALGQKVRAVPTGALVVGRPARAAGRRASSHPADVIVAVDGTPVRTRRGRLGGDARQGRRLDRSLHRPARRRRKVAIPIKTVAAEPGLAARDRRRLPRPGDRTSGCRCTVSIDANGVGGPSAGLAFALDVMEELGRNVDGGHKIAATGEIFLDGRVGPIGGVKQKTIGARQAGVDAFLVPVDNAREARKYAHGLRIIPVKSFQQALRALATLPQS